MRKILTFTLILAALASQAAKVDTLQVATKLLPQGYNGVVVITPEGHPQDAKFPTAYLLNGYSGCHTSWYALQPRIADLADLYGMVLVMPDGQDSWYWDAPVRPDIKMESFIIDELVPYIDSRYPTIPEAKKRAITGLSMGGHGALWLAMRHSDVFGNAGSMSGGVDIRPFPENWKMAQWLGPEADNQEVWDNHTVINLVPALRPGQLNLTIDCGVDDFFYQVNLNLHEALLDAGIDHDFTSRPGAHTGPYWQNSILYHLLFFNEAFNAQE